MPHTVYSRWERLKRASKYWYLRIIRQSATPHNIALGMGLGVFIGALPIMPFQSVTVIALAFLLHTNKFAAWLATCYSNVFTMVPFYSFLFMVGKFFFPYSHAQFDPSRLEMEQLIATGWDLFTIMTVGGLVFGIPAALVTYGVTLWAVRRYRKAKALRMLKKRSRL